MKIKIQPCFNGHFHYYCLLIPRNVWGVTVGEMGFDTEIIRGEKWDRAMAKEALDLLEQAYCFKRRNIRFVEVS